MSLDDVIRKAKKGVETRNEQTEEDISDHRGELSESLELLIERDNPMSEAAERALDQL